MCVRYRPQKITLSRKSDQNLIAGAEDLKIRRVRSFKKINEFPRNKATLKL